MRLSRKRWMAVVASLGALHFIVNRGFGIGSTVSLWWTDLGTTAAAAVALVACVRTARLESERENRIAWLAMAGGLGLWIAGAVSWSFRELVLHVPAASPTWVDAPIHCLAPAFAIAVVFYRGRGPAQGMELRQIADLGLLTATITIAGTLIWAPVLRASGFTPYLIFAIGYPGFYLAAVLVAVASLGRASLGPRRLVLGILVWANLALATVDVLYGAKVLDGVYQTGFEDTLWVIGFVSICWAAAEERALVAAPEAVVETTRAPTWNASIVAIAVIGVASLGAATVSRLEGFEWTVVAVAILVAAMSAGLRMYIGERAEASGAETERALLAEREKTSRLRAVSSLAGGTAHEVNNLLQAIAGSLALLRRRASRGEDVSAYVIAIEKALARLGDQVDELRKLSPVDPAQGMILLLPGGDPDGKLAGVLAEAGFAPAALPDVEAAQRAVKGPNVRALVASLDEAAALEPLGLGVPIIRRESDNILDAVVAVVEAVSDAPAA